MFSLNEKIKKRGNKWLVTSKSGKKILGSHDTKKAAIRQLIAIELSKVKSKKQK